MSFEEDLDLVVLQMDLDRVQLTLDQLEIDAPDSDEWFITRERRDYIQSQIQNLYLGL